MVLPEGTNRFSPFSIMIISVPGGNPRSTICMPTTFASGGTDGSDQFGLPNGIIKTAFQCPVILERGSNRVCGQRRDRGSMKEGRGEYNEEDDVEDYISLGMPATQGEGGKDDGVRTSAPPRYHDLCISTKPPWGERDEHGERAGYQYQKQGRQYPDPRDVYEIGRVYKEASVTNSTICINQEMPRGTASGFSCDEPAVTKKEPGDMERRNPLPR